MKAVKPYFSHKDSRGKILGISQFDWMREVNYIESCAASKRGGHYHKHTMELFYIIEGEINVLILNVKTKESKEFVVKGSDIFIIEPYEVHTFRILKDAKWINILSNPMDEQNSDFHAFES